MSEANLKNLEQILAGLMRRYEQRVPDVTKIVNLMIEEGLIDSLQDIENDHVAFRTMGVPQLGIASLEKIFLHHGYERKDPYYFEGKKLNAYWYAPPEGNYPRIFISELRVEDLSADAQALIRSYTDEVKADPVDSLDLDDPVAVDSFLHQALWRTPTWDDYSRLLDESEYAGWTIYNRYYLNHFTISVHNLSKGKERLEGFNQMLIDNGIKLNNSGGIIKTSPDGKLRQSSTVAQTVEAEFAEPDGSTSVHTIAGSYVEFAERSVLDEYADLPPEQIKREHRRDGFEAGNADKIFESTFRSQLGDGDA